MLIEAYPNLFEEVVSLTTRPMKVGEKNEVDYYFVTKEEF